MTDSAVPDTRLFVSGLPPNFTSSQLGAHFGSRYQVTDAVVVPDRRIGFVGFQNPASTKSAIKYFDKSYIRLSKISVGFARPIEIKRSTTSGAISESKRSGQGKAPRQRPLNEHPAERNVSAYRTDGVSCYETFATKPSTKKRKRSPQIELQANSTTPLGTRTPAQIALGIDNGAKKAVIDEREDGDGRKKEKKHEDGKRKWEKAGWTDNARNSTTPDPGNGGSVMPASAHQENGSNMGSRKEQLQERKQASAPKGYRDANQNTKSSAQEATPAQPDAHSNPQIDRDAESRAQPLNEHGTQLPHKSTGPDCQHQQNFYSANDTEWLRAKTSRLLDLVDVDGSEETSLTFKVQEQDDTKPTSLPEALPSVSVPDASIKDDSSTARLFVRNLPYQVTESDVQNLFSKYGHCDEVHLVRDKEGSARGIGYVTFFHQNDAERALQELDGRPFQGRLLHVLEAAEKKFHQLDEYEISKLPLKKQKTLKRRMGAGRSNFSWNSLYMNPDAVLSSVADRLGVPKADLIDASSTDAAVTQAHAETHVIQETKTYFASHGVDLQAFEHHDRDASILLVKNFPFGTTAEELSSLFGSYGSIVRCLIPPSGTIAIIQYSYSPEGHQAISHLAYRNFKGSILYLEKAPVGLFDTKSEQPMLEKKSGEQVEDGQRDLSPDAGEATSSTLFVRNLNFATTSHRLANAFRPLNGFLSAKVKTKIDPNRAHEILSMGFGFVEFRNNRQAQAALAAMNGQRLDDHKLVVQFSRKAIDAGEEQRRVDDHKKRNAHKTKFVIKNLPFEASKKDVRALLSAYGQLRSVKVPQKFDRSTRGFAFADFLTAKEAENAMEALRDTHLLGRRLVMEFADDETVDPEAEIRAIESKVWRQTDMIHLNKLRDSTRKPFNIGTAEE